jgi:hypothetical protein
VIETRVTVGFHPSCVRAFLLGAFAELICLLPSLRI